MLMVGTVIGPGTIFLMIVGSWSVAFHVDNWTSFWINLVPIMLFIIICLTTKAKTQVKISPILNWNQSFFNIHLWFIVRCLWPRL